MTMLTAVASLHGPMSVDSWLATRVLSRHFLVAGEMMRQDPKNWKLGMESKKMGVKYGKVWYKMVQVKFIGDVLDIS